MFVRLSVCPSIHPSVCPSVQVYDALDVTLEEVGESFYNPFIPPVIEKLKEAGLVEVEEGMLIVRLPHFTIPLIVRKSDGK